MEKQGIRLLKAEEIECRASVVRGNGLSLLLYKDARVDQRILDETFGPFGWKRSHQSIDGNLYCTVEVLDRESGEWVAKQDVGTTGHSEKEKSQASDSFKRACFNWGIGRELYTAPFIWVPADRADIRQKDGKYYCTDRFRVSMVEYGKEREITALAIVNATRGNQTAYELGNPGGKTAGEAGKDPGRQKTRKQKKTEEKGLSQKQMDTLEGELQRTGVGMDAVKKRYRLEDPAAMSQETYEKVMTALSRTKPGAA